LQYDAAEKKLTCMISEVYSKQPNRKWY